MGGGRDARPLRRPAIHPGAGVGRGDFRALLAGRIDANAYMLTTIGIVGGYITGNVAQKRIDAEKP